VGGRWVRAATTNLPSSKEATIRSPPEKLEQIPPEHRGGQPGPTAPHQSMGQGSGSTRQLRQFTVATGYVATGLLGLTLLIGPGYLLLRRRNPISTYLARDAGTWAAVVSVVHVILGLEVHASVTDPLPVFVQDGSPLTTSFGLGNWTGLAATVIVVALLATSSDLALRKLKARRWKRIQRLNYALFALVIAHAFFYGAVLRTDSPYTLLLS
jgi:methionine sulfoxide reductase heme-binding subunit